MGHALTMAAGGTLDGAMITTPTAPVEVEGLLGGLVLAERNALRKLFRAVPGSSGVLGRRI